MPRGPKGEKRPADVIGAAIMIGRIATGDAEDVLSREHARKCGAAGRKGISMRRHKGLGEMNPKQLWETTLNSNVRSLLRVKVSELGEADDIFTKLKGDVVEPRRDLIRENGLNVANLDV